MNHDCGCTRRDFISALTSTVLLSSCDRHGWLGAPKKPIVVSDKPQDGEPNAAPSLAALQSRCKRNGILWNSAITLLPRINEIAGFFIDDSNLLTAGAPDVIIYGRENGTAPIELDSLAVTLRNAYEIGGQYQGVPGCAIDPIPGEEDPFKIQKVSVFGMPRCRMAARFVNLDYELKCAGAGIVGEGGKILPNAFELADRNGPCSSDGNRAISMVHRYWVFPRTPTKKPRFERDGQTTSIVRPIGVQLLTEQDFLNRRVDRTGATEAGPVAKQFAEAVTTLLESNHRVARYTQMVADFRLIELARLMRFCRIPAESLSFLLRDYVVPHADVPAFVGGIQSDVQGRTVCSAKVTQTADGIRCEESVSHYRYEYRGGVEAKIEVTAKDIDSRLLDRVRRRVLNARPSPGSISWLIP